MKAIQLLIGVSILLFAISTHSNAQEIEYVKVGESAPTFQFMKSPTTTEKSINLKGKVILVNLFATWCPPCRKELPHIESEIWKAHKNNPNFTMLTFGREHSWEEINKFKEEKGYTFPIYPDPKRDVFSKFAKQSIPRSYLIDQNGTIVYKSTGFQAEEFEKLKNTINKLLK